jgi:hypothetical protein
VCRKKLAQISLASAGETDNIFALPRQGIGRTGIPPYSLFLSPAPSHQADHYAQDSQGKSRLLCKDYGAVFIVGRLQLYSITEFVVVFEGYLVFDKRSHNITVHRLFFGPYNE